MKNSYLRIIVFLIIAFTGRVNAQYNNEWINFNQSYYKIPIVEDGIYRLNYNDLSNVGFPVGSVNPKSIQIFHRGIEQAIYVEGESDASLDTSDFIEFYGERNDGTLDTEMYVADTEQPHSYYNLHSDTAAYFLTWTLGLTNGKRMPFFKEDNTSNMQSETVHNKEILEVYKSQYSKGRAYPEGLPNTRTWLTKFDKGEGWSGNRMKKGQSQNFALNLSKSSNSGTKPTLEVLLVGRNNFTHNATVEVGSSDSNLRTISNVNFNFYETKKITVQLEWSDVAGNNDLFVKVSSVDNGAANNISVSYIKVTYPQGYDMQGESSRILNIKANPSNKSYIILSNAPPTPVIYDLVDADNIRRIGFNKNGNAINAMVDQTISGRKLLVTDGSAITPIVKKINFTQITPAAHDYLIISNKRLMQPSGGYADPVEAYGAYRASEEGGGFSPLVVEMDQLYNQFSFGESTPLSIRKFADFMLQNDDLKYIFLIGKGLSVETSSGGKYYRVTPELFDTKSLIPAAGTPGSDIAFIAGLKGTTHQPPVPIGRLNAQNPEQVVAYLNKIMEAEVTPLDGLWRKRMVHLSGGLTLPELNRFANNVDELKDIAEGLYIGAKVNTLNKSSNSTIQLINIADLVNEGVSLITFFGHSAAALTDIEIGNVSDASLGYKNKGKYPFIMVNGCDAGNIFALQYTFGEDWVLTPDKGSLGFMAHTSNGYSDRLKNFSDIFYETAYGDSSFIHQSIGFVLKESYKRFINKHGADLKNINQVQQVVVQGDPAYRFFPADKPDYVIKNESIFFTSVNGGEVNAVDEKLRVGIIVENYGRADKDSLRIEIKRTLSDGNTQSYKPKSFGAVYHTDTLYMDIDMGGNAFGNNTFEVILDFANDISELNESNNTVIVNSFIPLKGTRNLLPASYAVMNKQPIRFVAQATNPFSTEREFVIELDTIKTFDSPFKKQTNVTSRILAVWETSVLDDISANDSTVYYWRSKYAIPLAGEDDSWSVSSFIYIKDSPEGWSQTRVDQFESSQIVGLSLNETTKKWQFLETPTSLEIVTYGKDYVGGGPKEITVNIQGQPFVIDNPSNRVCRNNSMNMIALDNASGIPYAVIKIGDWDVLDKKRCGRVPQAINNFVGSEITTKLYINQYIDGVKTNDYVLMFSIGSVNYASFPASTINKLGEIGVDAATISSLNTGEPLIILGKKGAAPGTAIVVVAEANPKTEQVINLIDSLPSKYKSGTITSTLVGPAASWDKFVNEVHISELPQTDEASFDIYGVTLAGQETILLSDVIVKEVDLSSISAAQYPNLKLVLKLKDEVNLTPAQIKKWQVYFESVPEGVIYMTDKTIAGFEKRETEEGQFFNPEFIFENISTKNFTDSIKVEYSIFNKDNGITDERSLKIRKLLAGEKTSFVTPISTFEMPGKNNLNVFVNPKILPEQGYNNNIIDIPNAIDVGVDDANPVMDVTFDGVNILDGDIVSASPLITVTMKDNNKFFFKSDTIGVEIFFGYPCVDCGGDDGCNQCYFQRINFSDPNMQWYAATENSDFSVEYRPYKLEDGVYALKTQVTDASGNRAGLEPYIINFEVINEPSITNFYPYPNPFSTSTRFVFTLTGSEIPEQIKIQILTVTGEIVREITHAEAGKIHVGNNTSSFVWDGKNGSGSQLANGIYLYRVIIDGGSPELKHKEIKADKPSNGYGKVYLLR